MSKEQNKSLNERNFNQNVTESDRDKVEKRLRRMLPCCSLRQQR